MNDDTRGAPFARTPEFGNRTKLQLCIASALAAGVIATAGIADARITKIEMTRTTAFGGYSFDGVGQVRQDRRNRDRRSGIRPTPGTPSSST